MKRQSSITELFKWQGASKVAKTSEFEPFSSLKAKLGDETWVKFKAEVAAEQATAQAEAAERKRLQALRAARKPGEIHDPSAQKRGVSTNTKSRQRPTFYELIGNTKHKRELGGPIVRRDFTAHEKLSILVKVDSECKVKKTEGEKEVAGWGTLQPEKKRELEERFRGSVVYTCQPELGSPLPLQSPALTVS